MAAGIEQVGGAWPSTAPLSATTTLGRPRARSSSNGMILWMMVRAKAADPPPTRSFVVVSYNLRCLRRHKGTGSGVCCMEGSQLCRLLFREGCNAHMHIG